jgi:hypothetical protein
MKTFETVDQALSFIAKKKSNGTEFIINDSLHFGVGLFTYTYSSDAKEAGITPEDRAFTHLDSEKTKTMLNYLLTKDGYLAC